MAKEKKEGSNHETSNEVKNAYEVNPNQEKLEAKGKAFLKLMNEEPKTRVVPYLVVSEQGIYPDARLVLVEDKEQDNAGQDQEGEETNGEAESSSSSTS